MADRILPTVSRLHELFSYDPEAGILRYKKTRGRTLKGAIAGHMCRYVGRCVIIINKRTYMAHRIIWCMAYGEWPTLHIDHKDGNPANNHLDNLREANRQQQARNTKCSKKKRLQIKGVSWSHNVWIARITIDGRTRTLGKFSDPIEAGKAYEQAAKLNFGEFYRAS